MKHLPLIATLLAVASIAHADSTNSEKPKPAPASEAKTAEEVFDRYTTAVGGRSAIEKIKTRVIKSITELPTFNITAKVETFAKAPDKYYTIMVIDAGTIERGFDGKTGWSRDPFGGGLRELTGLELAGLKQDSELHLPSTMKTFFSKAKLKGKERGSNGDAYVVDIPIGDKVEQAYFSADTGLLTHWKKEILSPQGAVPAEQTFEDYREVDGVKIAFTTTLTSAQFNYTNRLTEVKNNAEVPDDKFTKPAK
jgi:hypothetical protein